MEITKEVYGQELGLENWYLYHVRSDLPYFDFDLTLEGDLSTQEIMNYLEEDYNKTTFEQVAIPILVTSPSMTDIFWERLLTFLPEIQVGNHYFEGNVVRMGNSMIMFNTLMTVRESDLEDLEFIDVYGFADRYDFQDFSAQ